MLLSPLDQSECLWVQSEVILENVGLHVKDTMQGEGKWTHQKVNNTLCHLMTKTYY